MERLVLVLLLAAGCGGAADVSVESTNQQSQAQDEAQIQNAQEACAYCIDNRGKEETLSECVTAMGFDVSDC